MDFKMGKPNCGLCGVEIRDPVGKRRRVSEPTILHRITQYIQKHGGTVDPGDFICQLCSSKAYTYCRGAGVDIVRNKIKPSKSSTMDRPTSSGVDLVDATKRGTRSQAASIAQISSATIAAPVSTAATSAHVSPTNTTAPISTAITTAPVPSTTTTAQVSSAATTAQVSHAVTTRPNPTSSTAIHQTDAEPEQQEYEMDEAPQIQAQAVYSQSTNSGPDSQPKRIRLENVLTTTTTQSRCVVCQKKDPGNRKMVQQPAMLDLWVSDQIYLPKFTRTCLVHLDGHSFKMEAKIEIRKNCKYGPLVDASDIGTWLSTLTEAVNKIRTCLDFDDPTFPPGAYQDIVGISKENFDDLLKHVRLELNPSKNRSTRNALAIFMAKLRLGVSQQVLARLFGVSSQSVISRAIHSVCVSLSKHFVPMNLGLNHLSRQQILQKHSPEFVKKLFDVAEDNIAFILDGTYFYIQQASDHETQQRTYSAHKHRNLLKFMMVTTPDGHIIDAVGPYGADGPCSDAKILNGMLDKNGSIMSLLEPNDLLILDRGFRDSQLVLRKKDVDSVLPEFILAPEKQLTTQQANDSRKVTMVRWEVEGVNGRIKNKNDLLDNVIPISYVPIIGDIVRIACAVINKYSPPLHRESEKHGRIVERVRAFEKKENLLKSKVKIFELNKNAQWKKSFDADVQNFPRLTSEDLLDITLGSYQIKNAAKYNLRHLSADGLYELQIHKEASNIIRAKIESRFRRQIAHNVWIEYDNTKSGPEQIIGHYCKCQQGARVVGTCSHVTAVISYLGKERHEPQEGEKRKPFYSYLLDNADRMTPGLTQSQVVDTGETENVLEGALAQ